MKRSWLIFLIFALIIFALWASLIFFGTAIEESRVKSAPDAAPRIEPSPEYTQYWRYKGQDILLLGGSVEDNLFQIPDLENHLDILKSCGGNYVRNTMSSRDSGNVWPFFRREDGLYELDRWDPEYWSRFERFLQATTARDVIVQIEVWATFDFYREPWQHNPFNPRNTRSYSNERVRLPLDVPTHPTRCDNNFFLSIPSREHNMVLLAYQQKFVDKMLEHSLKYGNILYCIDNETSVTSEWGRFWSNYIRQKAREAGKSVFITEMWDPWDMGHISHRETTDHPELYDFVDFSQNNHNSGDNHWETGIREMERLRLAGFLRPVNNVKVYGNDGGAHQTTRNGIECFVRNVLMGAAGTRFHRPPSGQGLNETAQAVIRSMRSYTEKSDFFAAMPRNDLLTGREPNSAYCRAIPGMEYSVYLCDGAEANLDLRDLTGRARLEWLDITSGRWTDSSTIQGGGPIRLTAPSGGHWLALVKKI